MAQNRAAKSGIAAEAQAKMQSKWENERAITAVNYIATVINEPSLTTNGTMEDFHAKLENGMVLAKLGNWVKPGSCKVPPKAPTMAFKKMELIGLFLKSIDASEGGPVAKTELFQTVDLYEQVNLVQVVLTIEALGRAMLKQGRTGYGIKESDANKRDFSEEQLKAGANIIGLQMGSNKGASQAGQNFGKSRMIVD